MAKNQGILSRMGYSLSGPGYTEGAVFTVITISSTICVRRKRRMNPAILRATPVQRGRSLYFFFKIIWLKIIGNNYLPKL
ncbi:unnamed protein product [Nesidiocoris tenuis]|uniref:Uncharacterized protein n=1 Tax=Nesidiocoris tenuis TaxID=355587 RepID=A0A6H5HRJ6_9HEMI|nr:unnamed protein product [Nesidiocoris tenuis]